MLPLLFLEVQFLNHFLIVTELFKIIIKSFLKDL